MADKSYYRGARRADNGLRESLFFHISARVLCNYLSRLGHLVNGVKAALEQRGQDVVNVVKIVELTVERRRGQSDLILIVRKILELIVGRLLCLIRTESYALAAIYTLIIFYYCVSVANAYCLGRTSFYTVGTAFTF